MRTYSWSLGRPQTDVDVLVGVDGNFLLIVENIALGKAEKEIQKIGTVKIIEDFWNCGPICSTSYRFNRWLDSKLDNTVGTEM